MSENTLYQRIGGEAAIQAAVDRVYERVVADSSLTHFFHAVSMGQLKATSLRFYLRALGGPKQYSNASMS